MVKVLRFLRNLLLNHLPRSLICYSGDNRRAATLWSTFHHMSQEGFAFLYPHPHLLFVCWLCIDKVIILEPSQRFSVCYQPFDLKTGAIFDTGRLQIPQRSHICLRQWVKPASLVVLELYQRKGLSESRGVWVWLVSLLFLLWAGLSRPNVTVLSHQSQF